MTATRAKYGRYVGHDENLQTILILNTTTNKVYRAGLVKIVENIDQVGRIISNPDVSVPSYQYASHDSSLYTRPTPFTKKKNFSKVTSLLSIASYYDDEDKETYGLIQFTDSTHESTWTYVIHLLFYVTKDSLITVRDMFYALLETTFGHRTGNQNIHFPIFTHVDCNYEGNTFPGIIVSTDAHSNEKYGVIFYDEENSAVFHQDVTAGDIRQFQVDITYAALDSVLLPEPTHHRAAMGRPDAALWSKAEEAECDTMFNIKKCLQSTLTVPPGTVIMPMRWVYKIKLNHDGTVERYKARLVAKGYRQIPGVHFDSSNTFSPSASPLIFHAFITFVVTFLLSAFSMDVTAAFLNSKPKYDNYICLPDGFTYKGSKYAFMLKNIYGTRDAARGWYDDQHNYLMRTFPLLRRSSVDPCFYYILTSSLTVFMVLTVDDYAVATNQPDWYTNFVKIYGATYTCRDLGHLTLYNGIHIRISSNIHTIRLSQQREINSLLRRFNMIDCNSARTPMLTDFNSPPRSETDTCPLFDYPSLIGALLWIARMTRPDILFAVITLSAFMKTFTNEHVMAAKRILRYLKSTIRYSLRFVHDPTYDLDSRTVQVTSQSDADWGGDTVTRRSMTGAITTMFNCVIITTCRRQPIVALSTMEAELIALTEAARDHMSLRNFIMDIIESNNPIITAINTGIIATDNIATQFVATNRIFNNRTRHIDIRYMYIRELVEQDIIQVTRVESRLNVSDVFTKPLSFDIFVSHRTALGVVEDEDTP
jgi:hypothetical protein